MGVGVGKSEAAGVRSSTHIDGFADGLVQHHIHFQKQLPNDLIAGGTVGFHQLIGGIFSAGSVVIDPQIDAVFQFLKGLGQHVIRRHIHRNQDITLLGRRLGDSLH